MAKGPFGATEDNDVEENTTDAHIDALADALKLVANGYQDRQFRYISQRLEQHSESNDRKLDSVRTELKQDIAGVRAASESAHKEIISRLERLENRLS